MALESWKQPGQPNGPAVPWNPAWGADEAARGREMAREDALEIGAHAREYRPTPRDELVSYEDSEQRNAEFEARRAAYEREAEERRLLEREREREAHAEEREARRTRAAEERRLEPAPRSWVHHSLREEPASILVRDFLSEAQFMVSQEIRLARAELRREAMNAGKGASGVGVGGVLAFVGLLAFTAFVIAALALAMPLWASALIVGGLMLLVGAMIAMGGVAKLKALNPKPERTAETLKENREWASGLKRDVQSRRRGHA